MFFRIILKNLIFLFSVVALNQLKCTKLFDRNVGDFLTHIIIATHGTLAEGLLNAAELIIGPQDNVNTYSLNPEDSIEVFIQHMKDIVSTLNHPLLILVDLLGASPYNAFAQALSEVNQPCVLMTGVNLPMVIEACMSRDNESLASLSDHLKQTGQDGITSIGKE